MRLATAVVLGLLPTGSGQTTYRVSGGSLASPYYTFDSFDPATTTLVPGASYTWVANGISSSHPFAIGDVARSPLATTSGSMGLTGTGGSFTITIPNPVTSDLYYFCQVHASMLYGPLRVASPPLGGLGSSTSTPVTPPAPNALSGTSGADTSGGPPPATPDAGLYQGGFRVVLLGDQNLSQTLLPRTTDTSTWLNRDQVRVTIEPLGNSSNVTPSANGTSVDGTVGMGLSGSLDELFAQAYLTRHGLYRRTDAKFAEFVTQQNRLGDGYGLWRLWESYGPCPRELLITDPWGGIAWQARDARIQPIECSWVVRPGMYRNRGYMKVSQAPVTLMFRTFDLVTDVEVLEVYDGSSSNATLLGRFTGRRLPAQITSSTPEIRVVLRSNASFDARGIWANVTEAIADGSLRTAQRIFLQAQQNEVVGFVRQDMRRALRTVAVRLSGTPAHAWMRRRWFSATGSGFDREFDAELVAVLEDLNMWDKRSRQEEGKESIPWDTPIGSRRYPVAVEDPGRNPLYELVASSGDTSRAAQLRSYDGTSPREPSGWSLDFITTADCGGRGIAPYGEAALPPLTLSGNPVTNFAFLPFPLEVSSCQPLALSGPQVTASRPYTCARAHDPQHAIFVPS